MLYVNELYIIGISPHDEVPMFVFVTHIIEHGGIWIVCGLLSIAEWYSNLTDSYAIDTTDDYIVLSVSELKTHGPVTRVKIDGKIHVCLSHRVAG